jgi:hypothetical protein
VVILELCAQFFGRKPLSEQTTEGFERFGATLTRAVADREQRAAQLKQRLRQFGQKTA